MDGTCTLGEKNPVSSGAREPYSARDSVDAFMTTPGIYMKITVIIRISAYS